MTLVKQGSVSVFFSYASQGRWAELQQPSISDCCSGHVRPSATTPVSTSSPIDASLANLP